MGDARIHMVCGLTGAGKSTYSEALRRGLRAVRFSVDEWNARLFFPDRDPSSDFEWFYDRVQRSCAQMRDTAEQVLEAGRPVIFDCGFTDAKERKVFYDWADELGIGVARHYLEVDEAVRWLRTQERNADKGATFTLHVSREMFDFMDDIWEAPTKAEMVERNGTVIYT